MFIEAKFYSYCRNLWSTYISFKAFRLMSMQDIDLVDAYGEDYLWLSKRKLPCLIHMLKHEKSRQLCQ